MPKEEPPEERRAAAIVSASTGCQTVRMDIGDGIQRPDYGLIENGVDVGVLEITSFSWEAHNSFWGANAERHRRWHEQGLTGNWIVHMDSPQRKLRDCKPRIRLALAEMEESGTYWASAEPRNYTVPVAELTPTLRACGVCEVRRLDAPDGGGGQIAIGLMPLGGAFGLGAVTEVVNTVLQRRDNVAKLAGEHERRELFIWIDPPSPAASALSTHSDAMYRHEVASSQCPELRSRATAVWAALWSTDGGQMANALWRGDVHGWDVLTPPTV